MSLRCVVIDDEKPARDRIKRLLAAHPDTELVGEAADADGAVSLIDDTAPDVCFLDVQMPEGSGFDVLRRVRVMPQVIFVTAFDRYAVRAFEVSSVDYLLKPVSRGRFARALDRVRAQPGDQGPSQRLVDEVDSLRRSLRGGDGASTRPDRISAKRGATVLLLDPAEIDWFEAEDTLVFARAATGRFLVERTLAELERQLEGEFFRSHRSYLINLARIAEIQPVDGGSYRIVCSGGGTVPLSRRQARRLREVFTF